MTGIETLYVNGCSWTEGYLLQEQQEVIDYAKSKGYEFEGLYTVTKNGERIPDGYRMFYDNFNWAGNLARSLSIPNIVNQAEGAGSNPRVVRTTVEYIKNLTADEKSKTLVVIGWSLPDRGELFLDDRSGKAHWQKFNAAQEFSTIVPAGYYEEGFYRRISAFWKNYVVDVHNTYASVKSFFLQSALLANFLENQGVKYFFFNSFPAMWGFDYESYPDKLDELIKDREYYDKNHKCLPSWDTFVEFVGDDHTMRLSDGHPNIKAYAAWAEHIVPHIRRIYG